VSAVGVSAYVVLNCRGGRLGRAAVDMAVVAMEAKERELRGYIWKPGEEKAAFNSGGSRGIEGTEALLRPRAWGRTNTRLLQC
jgi:hypothetical protein